MIQNKLICKIRPERESNEFKILKNNISLKGSNGITFDEIILQNEKNSKIFELIKPILGKFFEGFNASVISFGRLRYGNSHVIFGNENDVGLFEYIMQYIYNYKKKFDFEVVIKFSYFEVCDNKLVDLTYNHRGATMTDYNSDVGKVKFINLRSHVCLSRSVVKVLKESSDKKRKLENKGHAFIKLTMEMDHGDSDNMTRKIINEFDIVDIDYNESNSLFDFLFQISEGETPSINKDSDNLLSCLWNTLSGNSVAALICNVQLSNIEDTKQIFKLAELWRCLKTSLKLQVFVTHEEKYFTKLNDEFNELINFIKYEHAKETISNNASHHTSNIQINLPIKSTDLYNSIDLQLRKLSRYCKENNSQESVSKKVEEIVSELHQVRLSDNKNMNSFLNTSGSMIQKLSELEKFVVYLKMKYVPDFLKEQKSPSSPTCCFEPSVINATMNDGLSILNITEDANKENGMITIAKRDKGNQITANTLLGSDLISNKSPLKEVQMRQYQEINVDIDTESFMQENSSYKPLNRKWKSYQTQRVLVKSQASQTY